MASRAMMQRKCIAASIYAYATSCTHFIKKHVAYLEYLLVTPGCVFLHAEAKAKVIIMKKLCILPAQNINLVTGMISGSSCWRDFTAHPADGCSVPGNSRPDQCAMARNGPSSYILNQTAQCAPSKP